MSEFDSKPLPTARDVSIQINAASGVNEADTAARVSQIDSLLMMQVGQFLDHDFAKAPTPGTIAVKLDTCTICFQYVNYFCEFLNDFYMNYFQHET